MKKWLKLTMLTIGIVVIAALLIVYFSLNNILRGVIEQQATASLNLNTTLASAHLSLFGGEFGMNDLEIASPKDFSAPHMFTLGGATVNVHYGDLTSQPIHIIKISIDSPILVVEQSNMKLNIQSMMDQQSQPPPPKAGGQPTPPVKLIIDELDLTNAQVNIQAGIPGLASSIQVPIPSMTLKNIGNADGSGNGAAIKDVVMQVVTALSAKATSSGKLPIDVNKFLNDNLSSVSAKLGDEFNKQLSGINAQLGQSSSPAISNMINSATTQGSQGLKQDLNNLLGGKK